MADRSALATVKLFTPQPNSTILRVWSRTYDDPDPARKCALVTNVSVRSPGGSLKDLKITDRAGVDHTSFLTGPNPDIGYVEYDSGGNVNWGAWSGIYDERCISDPDVDSRRLRSYRNPKEKVWVYNYILGPVDYTYTGQAGKKTTVEITVAHIGGNGGNPAQRSNSAPPEKFTIEL